MRVLVLILYLLPSISFAQTKDYKTYDKAVKYNIEGNTEKAIKFANKALGKNVDWSQPNLLLASIYANENDLDNCILVNERKGVVEVANANIFIVKNNIVKTKKFGRRFFLRRNKKKN